MGVNDGLASNQILSIQVSGVDSQATNGSFANLRLTSSTVTGSVADSEGRFRSISIGSPSTFGGMVQAGQTGPIGNGSGIITFGRSFSAANYAITVTALGSLATVPYVFSGTAVFTTSGCVFGGQSGTNAIYGYVAVGL